MIDNFDLNTYFQSKAANENSLFQVEIDVTSKCNADCPFCFQDCHSDNKKDMSLHMYKDLFKQLREMGVQYIGFSGGEPFSRNDFLDILKEAKKYAFRISLITNGMLLNDETIYELNYIGISRVTISFHSANKDNYLKSFGIRDCRLYENAKSNIKKLLEIGMSVGIAITITNINYEDLEETTIFLKKLGIKDIDINYNSLLSGKREISHLRPKLEDTSLDFANDIISEDENYGLLCIAGITSCSIGPEGDVFPCTFFNCPAGNLYKNNLSEIWNESYLFKMLRSLDESMFLKCTNCAIKRKCHYCLASCLKETGNMFMPSNEFCQSKKARAKWC